jgi:predicted ArsR family transcriptional regulator
MLASAANAAGVGAPDAVEASRAQGRALAGTRPAAPCVSALVAALDDLGFDPAVGGDDEAATVVFTHCPYRELAEAYPDLVCNLHRGLIEGFVAARGDTEVAAFGTLVDREPCQVELVAR